MSNAAREDSFTRMIVLVHRAFVGCLVLSLGCARMPPIEESPVEETPVEETPVSPARTGLPSTASWSAQPVFVGEMVGGPDIRTRVNSAKRLEVVASDGTRWSRAVVAVDDEPCDGDDELTECADVELQSIEERPDPVWVQAAAIDVDIDIEDIALLDTFVADLDRPPPANVSGPLRVHYVDALCEAPGDVVETQMIATSTRGPDPVAGAAFLGDFVDRPRRVITVSVGESTVHFVHATTVTMPRSRRMLDLEAKREESFWIVREDEKGLVVLHHNSASVRRSINHDFSCQLPIRVPVPFAVIDNAGAFSIYARDFGTVQRWVLTEDTATLEATWKTGLLNNVF